MTSKFAKPGSLFEALHRAPRYEVIEADTPTKWQKYNGPHGGHGWRNTTTGEVVYQEDMPQSHGGADSGQGGQDSGQQQGNPPADGGNERETYKQADAPQGQPYQPGEQAQQQPGGGSQEKEPQSPEEWNQFFDALQQNPEYQKVKSNLAKFKESSPHGDIRAWSKGKHSTPDGEYTPERKKLHEEIVKSMLNPKAAVPKGQRPAAVLLMGPPGAGKSTAGQPVAKLIAPEFTIVNSDDVKEKLPEYQGWNAALVHEESADVAEGSLTQQAIEGNHNTMFDLTGNNGSKMAMMAEHLGKLGYDVHVVQVQIPAYKSSFRAWQRFAKNAFSKDQSQPPGRFVPPDYAMKDVDGNPERTYEKLKNHPAVKSWVQIDNDVPHGSEPKVIDQGKRGTIGKMKQESPLGGHGKQAEPQLQGMPMKQPAQKPPSESHNSAGPKYVEHAREKLGSMAAATAHHQIVKYALDKKLPYSDVLDIGKHLKFAPQDLAELGRLAKSKGIK